MNNVSAICFVNNRRGTELLRLSMLWENTMVSVFKMFPLQQKEMMSHVSPIESADMLFSVTQQKFKQLDSCDSASHVWPLTTALIFCAILFFKEKSVQEESQHDSEDCFMLMTVENYLFSPPRNVFLGLHKILWIEFIILIWVSESLNSIFTVTLFVDAVIVKSTCPANGLEKALFKKKWFFFQNGLSWFDIRWHQSAMRLTLLPIWMQL